MNKVDAVAWIFQCNPKRFNATGYLKHSSELHWRASAYKDVMSPGQACYLWESGPEAGLIAVGKLTGYPVEEVRNDSLAIRFSMGLERDYAQAPTVRAPLVIESLVEPRLYRREVLEDRILENLTIVRSPQGTSFGVDRIQKARLDQLIASRRSPL